MTPQEIEDAIPQLRSDEFYRFLHGRRHVPVGCPLTPCGCPVSAFLADKFNGYTFFVSAECVLFHPREDEDAVSSVTPPGWVRAFVEDFDRRYGASGADRSARTGWEAMQVMIQRAATVGPVDTHPRRST